MLERKISSDDQMKSKKKSWHWNVTEKSEKKDTKINKKRQRKRQKTCLFRVQKVSDLSDKKCFELERRLTSIKLRRNNARQTSDRDASSRFVRWLGSKFDGCGRQGCPATGPWPSSSLSAMPPATSPARRSFCRSFWPQSRPLFPVSLFIFSVIEPPKNLNDRLFSLGSFRKLNCFQTKVSFYSRYNNGIQFSTKCTPFIFCYQNRRFF